jgi:hypothetical protein
VIVDINSGAIVWARILTGPELLRAAVLNVVCQAKFAPTLDADVKVGGTLVYTFGKRRS